MRDCVHQALHEVALSLEEKRISVRAAIEPTPKGLVFDKSQIEQALVNLLDNACKFTPRNGAIEIRGYPFFWERRVCRAASLDPSMDRRVQQTGTPNSFRVDIRDSGPGIPTAHVVKIFEEYTSYSGGQDRSGGGLGLAICRMVLQQHGGHIWAESQAAGAVFSFVLPMQPADPRIQHMDSPNGYLAGVEEGLD
jgi:two-component system clock-associated histidine kinase SasA